VKNTASAKAAKAAKAGRVAWEGVLAKKDFMGNGGNSTLKYLSSMPESNDAHGMAKGGGVRRKGWRWRDRRRSWQPAGGAGVALNVRRRISRTGRRVAWPAISILK